jgi:hypothetical protein
LLAWLALAATACSVYDSQLISQHQNGSEGAGSAANGDGERDGGGTVDRCGEVAAGTACARPNAEATCVGGECLIVRCHPPFVDCDQDQQNGCEARLDSPDHCSACVTTCRFDHAAASCKDGQCAQSSCQDGYADCDGDSSNGCETLLNTLRDCGACGHACKAGPHAVAQCDGVHCNVGSCDPGFGDCNSDPADGCEQALDGIDHCGACATSCSLPNTGQSICASGACIVQSCAAPYQDCNGLGSDGCESDLASADNCGSCGRKCVLPNALETRCALNGDTAGCQIARSCAIESGTCAPSSAAEGCKRGFADCDGKPENGCETPLGRGADCAACKDSCALANTLRSCQNGACQGSACAPGFGKCDGTTCQSLASDPLHCGSCSNACPASAPQCSGGVCTAQTCAAGTADCDGSSSNACEINVNDVQHCGGCGIVCGILPHASVACSSGSCAIAKCDAGYSDCNGDPSDGCEVDLHTLTDCGACKSPCNFGAEQGNCSDGQCHVTNCDAGRADCNGDASDGCETDVTLPGNCGACGRSCQNLQFASASSCTPTGCTFVCQPGHADCDHDTSNGCEVDLSQPSNCGACGKDCGALAHVQTATCAAGSCGQLICDPNYADCNGDASDGCERATTTVTDCGGCDLPCSLAHATGDCSSGSCSATRCDSGFGDCDQNAHNGCEAPLNTPDHCGACGTTCLAGTSCNNGACGCSDDSQCASGESCCDGSCVTATVGTCVPYPCIPGLDLSGSRANCGACGAICLLWCCINLL